MLAPSAEEYEDVAKCLEREGFRNLPWSYGSLDPEEITKSPHANLLRKLHDAAYDNYKLLNDNSKRYKFPLEAFPSVVLAILDPKYVHLDPARLDAPDHDSLPQSTSGNFTQDGIFLFPDTRTLLESFMRALVKEKREGTTWAKTLYVWITSYVCAYLPVEPDAMDDCEDEAVRERFSTLIKHDFVTRLTRFEDP